MEKAVWEHGLSLTDTGLGDDGALTSWGIEYCGVDANNLAIEKLIAHLFRSIQILRKTGLQLSLKKCRL
jgi:hypothetical protein